MTSTPVEIPPPPYCADCNAVLSGELLLRPACKFCGSLKKTDKYKLGSSPNGPQWIFVKGIGPRVDPERMLTTGEAPMIAHKINFSHPLDNGEVFVELVRDGEVIDSGHLPADDLFDAYQDLALRMLPEDHPNYMPPEHESDG